MNPNSQGNGNGLKEFRRQLITSLLIRRPNITQRQIHDTLATQIVNPKSGRPYALGTINNDLCTIREGWQEKAERNYGTWVAEMVATLEEVEKEGWVTGDLNIVLKALAQKAKLKGLDAPEKLDLTGTVLSLSHNITLTDEQRSHAVTQLLDRFSEKPDRPIPETGDSPVVTPTGSAA